MCLIRCLFLLSINTTVSELLVITSKFPHVSSLRSRHASIFSPIFECTSLIFLSFLTLLPHWTSDLILLQVGNHINKIIDKMEKSTRLQIKRSKHNLVDYFHSFFLYLTPYIKGWFFSFRVLHKVITQINRSHKV